MFNNEIRKFYDWGDAGSDAMTGVKAGAALGSVVPGVGTLVGAAAGGLIGAGIGFFQKKKGNALLKNNPYPNMPVPNEVLANQQAAERAADEGTPSAQYEQAKKNIQQQQATAISASQDRRLGGATIGAIQEGTNNATGQLDAQSAANRRANQLNLQTVNNQVASYRDKAFDWNQKNKYLQNYQMANSLIGVGNQNMLAGADKLLGGIAGGYANGLFSGRSGGSMPTGNAGYISQGTGLAGTGATGYTPGSNTDTILNPNGYSQGALIQ